MNPLLGCNVAGLSCAGSAEWIVVVLKWIASVLSSVTVVAVHR